LPEAAERLFAPGGAEEFSLLGGAGALIVDLHVAAGSGDATDPDMIAAALARLPAPSIALWSERAAPASARFVEAFDVRVEDAAALAEIVAGIERTPLAATALVQLLRLGASLDVHSALVAESLVYSMLQAGPEFAAWLDAQPVSDAVESEPGPAVVAIREAARLVLELNRPRSHNAFSAEMRDALCEALAVAAADPGITEVVVSGRGPSFSSGGDLREFGTFADPATAHMIRSTRNAGRMLADLADRVTARVHGACIGAGVELPAFAARVEAKPDAYFELPELSMGLVPGAGGTASIPRRIGRQRTALMALTGRRVDAATALAWGLVDAIV
jgi:enoyl-CoA hydratase